MINFIKRAFWFAGILGLLGISTFMLVGALQRKTTSFSISTEVKYVVLGHSHPECAYNDSLIQNFRNLAISGEAYFYTYTKLKKLIEQNKGVELVFIEFTNNQISESINEWVWADKYLSYHYTIYSSFIELRDKYLVFKNNPKGFIANSPLVLKNAVKKLISTPYNIPDSYGGFASLEGDLTAYREKANNQEAREDFVVINNNISQVQISYLSKIVSFLQEENVKVCLIRSPQHASYSGLGNEGDFQEVLTKSFSEEYFIDLIDFPLNDTHFRDPEHLNHLGAKAVSSWVNDLLLSDFFQANKNKKHWDYKDLSEKIKE